MRLVKKIKSNISERRARKKYELSFTFKVLNKKPIFELDIYSNNLKLMHWLILNIWEENIFIFKRIIRPTQMLSSGFKH